MTLSSEWLRFRQGQAVRPAHLPRQPSFPNQSLGLQEGTGETAAWFGVEHIWGVGAEGQR